ncbi:MAG: hypothetical protein FWD91_01895 [Treponema sp.]|nr:hypothetical protein [Treponema sp.]
MRKNTVAALCAVAIGSFFLLGMPPAAFAQAEEETVENTENTDTTSDTIQTTIPDALRRPQRGEAARFPTDLEIGELGQGKAPDGAYLFATEVLAALAKGNSAADALSGSPEALIAGYIEELSSIQTARFRIGGGRIEADETVSFLVRFLGSEEGITGELFLVQKEDRWRLDELILEPPRTFAETRDAHRFVFSPYERFF